MLACKECIYFKRLYHFKPTVSRNEPAVCTKFYDIEWFDYKNGKEIGKYESIETARSNEDLCGHRGRYWVKKQPWLGRVIDKFGEAIS